MPFEPRTLQFIKRAEFFAYLKKYSATIPGCVNYLLNTSVEMIKTEAQWIVESTTW